MSIIYRENYLKVEAIKLRLTTKVNMLVSGTASSGICKIYWSLSKTGALSLASAKTTVIIAESLSKPSCTALI